MLFLIKVLKNASASRLRSTARWVQAQCGRKILPIYLDMVWCALRHGAGYCDYANFGFWQLTERQRATYVTRFRNKRILDALNQRRHYEDFNNKHRFHARYAPLMRRETLDLTEASPEAVRSFFQRHPIFFAKRGRGCGGQGVHRRCCADAGKGMARLTELLRDGETILEEPIDQHPALAALHSASVNTLRVVTDWVGAEVHISYVLLKIGRGGAPCDNTGCGGMFCRVDASRGIVISDATDDSRNVYSEHPETHQAFFGLRIPRFSEALLLAVRCAALAPEVRHIGWDIAITPDGAELVEGNADPGVMCQFAPHTPEKRGLWPYYQALLRELRDDVQTGAAGCTIEHRS